MVSTRGGRGRRGRGRESAGGEMQNPLPKTLEEHQFLFTFTSAYNEGTKGFWRVANSLISKVTLHTACFTTVAPPMMVFDGSDAVVTSGVLLTV